MPTPNAANNLVTFTRKLAARWRTADSLLCVGLDPDRGKFPPHLRDRTDSIYDFCRAIVDATADLVCAFKPQIAYFASQRAEDALERLIAYIHRAHADVPVILDAKRGDMGSTAEHYAREAFDRYNADALTVNPYLGFDSIEPYLAHRDRGVFLVCRTSNAGGADLQMLEVESRVRLFEHVAQLAGKWNTNGQIGLVVGATYPAELARVRVIAGDMPVLVPGIGAQGGDVQAAVAAGKTAGRDGLVVSSSRAILYAGGGEDFALQARAAALATRDEINRYRPRPGA